MTSADALITRDGPVAAPFDYQVPAGSEIAPVCVTASFDGTTAGAAFVPTLEVLAPDGRVVARCPLATSIAAGGSADVSWFPWRRGVKAAAAHAAVPNSQYQAAILALNPFGYWPMDDAAATGHWTDVSGNGHNTSSSPDSSCFTQVTGLIPTSSDTAAQFVGGPSTMHDQGSITLPALSALTWMCWIRTTDTTISRRLWGCGIGANVDQQTFDIILTGGIAQFTIYSTNNTFTRVQTAASIADGRTHFLVGVWNGSTLTAYVDAVQITPANTAATPLSGAVHFGLNGAINFLSGGDMAGTYDEAALFLAALTSAQVQSLYASATST